MFLEQTVPYDDDDAEANTSTTTTTINTFLNTTPARVAISSLAIDTARNQISCPGGFVIPEEPEDRHVTWIEGTACADSCRYVRTLTLQYSITYSLVILYSFAYSDSHISPSYTKLKNLILSLYAVPH
jgi:hypothetical protein